MGGRSCLSARATPVPLFAARSSRACTADLMLACNRRGRDSTVHFRGSLAHVEIPTDVLSPANHAPIALKLVVVSGPDYRKELLLDQGTYRIGKDPACELVLADSAVSRTHLIVEVIAEGVRLTDPGSTNGSFCDGVRFTSVVANPPARIRVGKTELELVPRQAIQSGPAPSNNERFGELIGKSLAMRRVFALLERLAPTDTDVLIQGETGCGKELTARSIHAASKRAQGPFVACDL